MNQHLQHHGVKGMKWGVRKDRKGGSSGQNGNKAVAGIKERWSSLKRERDWKKTLSIADTLTNAEITKIAARIQLENDFKRLSKKKKIAGPDDRKLYRQRDKLSDKDLFEKVSRLRVKDNLLRTVTEASKEQTDVGKRIVKTAASIGLKLAVTGTASTKDLGLAALNPNSNIGKYKSEITDRTLTKYERELLNIKRGSRE